MSLLAAVAKVDTGDTAWMLVATALVLLMTVGLGIVAARLGSAAAMLISRTPWAAWCPSGRR